MIRKVEDLDVYQRSYRLALEIHRETLKFPFPDKWELGSQIRRASKSIPTNIAEGFSARVFAREYSRYLNIARASCDELFVHLKFAFDLGYLDEEIYRYYLKEYKIVVKELSSLLRKWREIGERSKL